jgi:sugar lactone lactonase YvrE
MQNGLVRPEVLDGVQTRLGESPWWDGARLSWVDILGKALHTQDLTTGDTVTYETPGVPGFAIPTEPGDWAVGLGDGLYTFAPEGERWRQTWIAPHDPATHRMNDAKTDSRGRLWMGSMTYEEREPVAALYRSSAGHVDQILPGIITSNGLGWSPDERTFYFTDSIARLIWAFDFDPDAGLATNQRIFAQDPSGYVPDGLAVDDEGCVWSCKWDGAKIVRYSPDGRIVTDLAVPVARPTSCAFVGCDRSTLAVTTALPSKARRAELDGTLLLFDLGVTGPQLHSVAV